jgi:putative hydrolase of the HAD superfamily
VRAVIFDFSGTLFQISAYAERIRAVMPAGGREESEQEVDGILADLEKGLQDPEVVAAQKGRDTSSEAHRHAFTTWYASAPALAPYAEALYAHLQDPEHWHPYADAQRTLDALIGRGTAVGILSDIGWDLRPTFTRHGFAEYVSSWVHSYEHGTEKPDSRLFLHACEELGAAPEETLMVGDNPVKDGGAVATGLRAYVLPSGASPGGERGLDAVLRLLPRLP